jgi:hypothetical protein
MPRFTDRLDNARPDPPTAPQGPNRTSTSGKPDRPAALSRPNPTTTTTKIKNRHKTITENRSVDPGSDGQGSSVKLAGSDAADGKFVMAAVEILWMKAVSRADDWR